MSTNKLFVITVDTEPDNEWDHLPFEKMTCENANAIPLFHDLCRRYDISPVYLVDYQMCCNGRLQQLLSDYLEKGECEVGAHLHPWSTPPYETFISDDDFRYHPFITEYPLEVFESKLECLVQKIRETFGISPVSFRAGRYVLGKKYALNLKKFGFEVDCSVTPYRAWESQRGALGSDYSDYSPNPFYWDDEKTLLELPLSAINVPPSEHPFNPYKYELGKMPPFDRVLRTLERHVDRRFLFYLKGVNWFFRYKKYSHLLDLLQLFVEKEQPCFVQAMLHSSELMAGTCFLDESEVTEYFAVMEKTFQYLEGRGYESRTLNEVYELIGDGTDIIGATQMSSLG